MAILFACDFSSAFAQTSSTPTVDIGWPGQVTIDGNTLIYYQPQVDEWKDYKELDLRMAFSITPKNGKQSLGVASISCGTLVDKDPRTVYFRDIHANDVRFPSLMADSAKAMEKLFRDLLPTGGEPISDRLLADLHNDSLHAQAVQVNNYPPPIFYSSSPAILLMVDGEPVLTGIEKTDLAFVVNTNWDLFFDKSKKENDYPAHKRNSSSSTEWNLCRT